MVEPVAQSTSSQSQEKIGITILGSTGSIGESTLDVLSRHTDRFHIVALTANSNSKKLFQQIQHYRPQYAVLCDSAAAAVLRAEVKTAGLPTEVLEGVQSICDVAALESVGYVMAAIVGGAGLLPTLAAVDAGKRILLANKEALVMSGNLFMQAVADSGAELLPIDSEHNAIFQCMPAVTQRLGEQKSVQSLTQLGIARILLTGSGGPFRQTPIEELASVTPNQACAHPNWSMGRKISVDSATMMNKGLELIEACWLFDARPDQVEVVLHPQSVVHSMVEYVDGSVVAQLGHPDMRTPIAYGLGWPDRIESGLPLLDLIKMGSLHFEEPNLARFPALRLSREAIELGKSASIVLNAANEVAVAAFLNEQIRFTAITEVIERVLASSEWILPDSIDTVLAVDEDTRRRAAELVAALARR
ncbi:MAG: 1-deoxy-D-xylulose-5-phosphate reductoisomerase [Moraxellaceae bacterium]|nr:MAG: 1-deoxy-D-xylulose-5-phosphate reductoisomerase [Moraxellaceae bacterium]